MALLFTDTASLETLRERWDVDLRHPLTDTQWMQATAQVKHISRNMGFHFTQFNYLHRTYLMSHRIARMYPTAPDTCPHCSAPGADFMYMIWDCTIIKDAWEEVINITSEIVEVPAPDTPESCLLGIRARPKGCKYRNRFIDLPMALYKRQIARHWKARTPPNTHTWAKVLLKWAVADSTALSEGGGRATRGVGLQVWDSYVQSLEAKDETRPP